MNWRMSPAILFWSRPVCRRWLLATLAACCAPGILIPAWGQEAVTTQASRIRFDQPSGVRIDVTVPPAGTTNEEIARALEQAARQLRARPDGPGTPPPAILSTPVVRPASEAGRAQGARFPESGSLPEPGAQSRPEMRPPESGDCTPTRMEGACGDTHAGCDPAPRWTLLPSTLLWEPPLANPLQPRLYVKPTTLDTENTHGTVDTGIGGTAALWRWNPTGLPNQGIQGDVFAVIFSRWSSGNISTGVDYRFGFPFTFAYGPWEGKLAYEHTSTHVGDDFIKRTGRLKQPHVRDEVVVGLARRFWDQARVYGQIGYAFQMDVPDGREDPVRYNWGVEWSRRQATGFRGQPFAAFDMDLRGDQGYTPNMTAQVGWQWRAEDLRPSLRVALELYHGRSPFGQFFRDREKWVGIGAYFDY